MSDLPARIVIDLEDMMVAMQNHDFECTWILDLRSGELILAGDGMVSGEDIDIDDFLDKDPDRYRIVDSIPSKQGYRVMEDFVEAMPHGHAQTQLRRAIERSRPFRNFKDTLLGLGKLKDQWDQLELQAYKRFAEDWLKFEEIEADLVVRKPLAE